MKVLVPVKRVVDYNVKIRVKPDNSGVDLSKPLPPALRQEIVDVWHEYHVVVFRDQQLTTAQHAAFCEQFGPLAEYPFVEATTDHPNVIPIIKEATQQRNFGGAWHTDSSYMATPPMATCLYAVEVPTRGGDTMFANTAAAFEALSPAMQRWIENLTGVLFPAERPGAVALELRHRQPLFSVVFLQLIPKVAGHRHDVEVAGEQRLIGGLLIGVDLENQTVDLGAPGVDVYSTNIGSGYRYASGTSMAWDSRY